jgi:biotin carboxyl carrier protein
MENEIKTNNLVIDDTVYETQLTKKYRQRKPYAKPNPKMVQAVIPGIIREIYVKPGQTIKEGDKILMLEAMKMKNLIASLRSGVVKSIRVEIGDMVYKGQILMEID